MQQLLRRLILFLSLAATVGIIPRKAFATHLAGSDISYTCIGGNNYRVDLTFYRDCRGQSGHPNGVGIEFRSVSCNRYFTDTLLLVPGSGQEISYPCPGLTTACDDPTSPNPGIQEYKYSGIINFPQQCADWVIGWTYCCRNCDITTMVQSLPCTPGNNPSMYISSFLDNLNYTCNSSPYFTNKPIVFICVGQNFTYNHGAVDPDGDSLVYTLVNPLINATDSIPFVSGYSATNPITSSPTLSLNPLTGDINITPTQIEVGVLSVLVEEYRNGVLIGHVVRDMEIYVQPCTNIIPTATGMNGTTDRDTTVCPNTQICFDVLSNDMDAGQIVTMSWNQAIANATFTISGFPYPTGRFCWTPTINDISTIPHQFTVSVVDNACPNNGYQTYSFSILINSPLVNINTSNITCAGYNNGSITVVPVNPGGYSYLWSPGGQTTAGITNLPPGPYAVTVYDSTTGCAATFPDTIYDPPGMSGTASVISSSCPGSASGVATIVVSGGTPSYTYSWNTIPPTLNDTASGLAPGTYIVTATDNSGCTITDSVTINPSSSALILNVDTVSTLLCYTDTNGIASISASGGTPGYTYLWNTSPPQSGPTATGLGPGSYFVTVTDTLGCSNTDTVDVNSPPQILMVGSVQNASCNAPDGIAIVTVSGGVVPYTYSWVGYPSTDDSLINVFPGLYTVSISDSNSCSQQLQILVGSQVISTTAGAISPVVCHGDSNAVAVISSSGGTPPYSYSWNTIPPQANDTATGLPAGQYIINVTDSNNCITVDTVNIPDPSLLNLSVSTVNASCVGDSSGSAIAVVTGGAGSYTYLWSPYGGVNDTALNLIPDTFQVTITDGNGCVLSSSFTIGQNTVITLTVDSVLQPVCNGTNTGAIYISVNGGTGAYSYAWNPGTYITQDISNINSGIYQVTVSDQNGCTQQQQINVNQPPPPPANAGNDTAICNGNSIQLLAAQLSPGSTGVWSSVTVNTFIDINDPNTVVTYVPPGNNTITWTVTDSIGCVASDNIQVFNYFNSLDAGFDLNLCSLDPIQLNASSYIGFNGLWTSSPNVSFVDPVLYNTFANLLSYGVDTLVWTISNAACSASDFVVISAYENPTADAGTYSTICEPVGMLEAISPTIGSGSWSILPPQQANIANTLNPITDVTNLQTGKTIFIWTVTNGTCAASDTVSIDYDDACEIKLPTAFSPNGDGYNDGYVIKGIEGYPENVFRVFNRWGNEVYVKENYKNADWIGQNKNGEELPEGTYFVILVVRKQNIVKNTYVDIRRNTGK
jgi:gliding motility-associated-like protein